MTHSFRADGRMCAELYASYLLNARGNGLGDRLGVAGVLLNDRDETGVEESDLEEHQERERAVDLVGERIENRGGEIQAERELDERLNRDRLVVLLADPFVGGTLDLVLRRPCELRLPVEQRFEDRARVVDRQADADRHQERQVLEPRDPVAVDL